MAAETSAGRTPGWTRHFPLRDEPWDAAAAEGFLVEIAEDAFANFDAETFWPSHPLDELSEEAATSLYMGAAGMIWGLDYLRRQGVIRNACDFAAVLPRLFAANTSEFAQGPYPQHGSLLFGDLGLRLVAMRLEPHGTHADALFERAAANSALPTIELMWGLPGSMLACVFASEMTQEPRWESLYREQATRLLSELEETPDGPLWDIEVYGGHTRYLGPVHGYAGHMLALMRGWSWLSDAQRAKLADAVPRTLSGFAWHTESGVTWGAQAQKQTWPVLCQHCHGAAGMVTAFAGAPFRTSALDALLHGGGDFTWHAGPLVKGSNLCHGTGGNGYAFLKLYKRTGDTLWLKRARAFAMTAISQCRGAHLAHGRGRYSLWTGDVGLAIYLWDCLAGEARFPTIDVI